MYIIDVRKCDDARVPVSFNSHVQKNSLQHKEDVKLTVLLFVCSLFVYIESTVLVKTKVIKDSFVGL